MNSSRRGEVTVHAPGLLGPWPAALADDVSRGLDLPGLVGLLARARRRRGPAAVPSGSRRRAGGGVPGIGIGAGARRPRSGGGGEVESPERLVFGAFGYPSAGNDDVPAAELMWEAETGRTAGAGRSFLLRADPVHLRADLDAARLFDSSHFALTREEADAMAGALDRHFASEGLRFEAPHPARWYVRTGKRPDAGFCPPGGAMARGAGRALPSGNEGSVWRRRMNEAQMVLHAHPVNEAREARGELPVNSVWFWGAGTLGDPPRRPRFHEVVADDRLVRALGRRGGARVRGLNEMEEGEGGLAEGVPGSCLIAPGTVFYRAVTARDVEGWRRGLVDAERRWFGPLLEAMGAGRISKATLDTGLRAGAARLEAGGRWMRRIPRPDVHPSRPSHTPRGGLAPFLVAEDG